MKKIFLVLIFNIFIFSVSAQVEKVIVETYYISDSIDATDTTGGLLEAGSTTYRIYIDLKPGSKIRKIYGDENHAIKIKSTANFFNNKVDGQSFAKDFSKNRFGENTVALDSWITLGQTTKIGTKTYFGILKAQDTDGSFIGGSNNDGGSEMISNGLLTNNAANAGSPLTVTDGMDTMNTTPTSWADYGIRDLTTGDDSTIFGSIISGKEFVSNYMGLQNSGTTGVIADSNQILIAQLTTKGELTFELNIEIEELDGTETKIVKYVANDSVLLSDEKLSRHLKYPFVQKCSCPDTDYLEYSSSRDCDSQDSCKTRIVFGCMDPLACNYNPNANFNLQALCCYPGYCNDLDLSLACPSISNTSNASKIYPNPTENELNLEITTTKEENVKYEIYDYFGTMKFEKDMGIISGSKSEQVEVSNLNTGIYLIRISIGNNSESKLFNKR